MSDLTTDFDERDAAAEVAFLNGAFDLPAAATPDDLRDAYGDHDADYERDGAR
ncbi:hypothetical protein AMIS_21340 [Actinoplanes missouriensis 431]|uniref:Uncharacterized protein n=1 Tax=Actinoplanes missouriensis (strain ATCC 14538 / DSM 43046 / CBS 188.64 / JCM 3121 / NBRC 102363 / NCIMB 12654 / NRRL B-3342 / UNCC 431) TaxID=512565 RepID=I0H2W7_ACTM4|nr:hypothetical protein [Actinoplanes missouriensis]BAL87354.1 hypothetical protein AMIS_21340 [Actinoplanes missouriensis 431]